MEEAPLLLIHSQPLTQNHPTTLHQQQAHNTQQLLITPPPPPHIHTSTATTMAETSMPRLRIVTPKEVDDLAKLNEPVEAQAREQAMEIVNDIKVRTRENPYI
jgi:hypothetical protein